MMQPRQLPLTPDEGGRASSGPLQGCYTQLRLCALTGGDGAEARSRDCFLAQNPPPTFLISTGSERGLAKPAPLRFFYPSKACSDTFASPECLAPLQVWFPQQPDANTDALAYRACCTPPAACPSGSQLCPSTCRASSLRAWLELGGADSNPL
jgi:hypothetical protein